MINYYDLFYTAEVLVGSESQAMNLIWDTGSDWLMVESADCTNCNGDTFDYTVSETFQISSPTTTLTATLGDGTVLTGEKATDTVCINSDADSCIDNFQFVAVNS